ncbi:DUF2726 domain-containing protein, partial [Salmonella enterica]|nr:DUF2726 domain-containing protein [Salmonella enterica]
SHLMCWVEDILRCEMMWFFCVLILLFFLVIIPFFKLKNSNLYNTDKKKKVKATDIMSNNNNSFERKPFLTKREREFFNNLRGDLKSEYYVFSQVRVVDIITPNKQIIESSREFNALFRQVSQWHCDFLIINRDFNVELAIELDDSTHNHPKRKRRDEIFNTAFSHSGITLIRVCDYRQFLNLPQCSLFLKNNDSI